MYDDKKNANVPHDILQGRHGEVWQHYSVKRWTQEKIAREFGISQQRVSQILRDVRAAIDPPSVADARQESIELYHNIIARMHELADMNGAPVTAGKDGEIVLDPETGRPVRDYGARIAALAEARKAEAELRKLLGLDSATRIESTSTVKYVVEGVDTSKLT